MENELEFLRNLEVSLHQFELRSDIAQLKRLLHPEFREVGYSGRTFDLDATLAEVPLEEKPSYKVWSQSFEFVMLSPELVQLFYLQARLDESGELSRFAKRTSIWQKIDDHWLMRFHQGTPTQPFVKSTL